MVVSIEIDDAVFELLGKAARPFVETPNDVLRRLLGLEDEDPGLSREGAESISGSQDAELSQIGAGKPRDSKSLLQLPIKPHRKRAQRIPAGEMLPLEEYCPYILRALTVAGGRLRSREMPEALLPLVEERLTSVDMELDETGVPRWHKRVGWAGSMCRKAGHLDLNAPRGVWQITLQGRRAATQRAFEAGTEASR